MALHAFPLQTILQGNRFFWITGILWSSLCLGTLFAPASMATGTEPAPLDDLPSIPDLLQLDAPAHLMTAPPQTASMAILSLEGVSSYNHYIQGLHTELRKHWKPKELTGRSGGRTVVSFEVSRNGELGAIQIAEPSGSKRVDDAAIEAIQTASPFPPFPEDLPMEKMLVQYTFDFYKPF